MVGRDTIAATIATTTVGKEEPGAIRAFSLHGLRRGIQKATYNYGRQPLFAWLPKFAGEV